MHASTISIYQHTRHFKETLAVDQLSQEVQAFDIFDFLGRKSAGKTTTFCLLNGVSEPTSGSMCVLGLNPQVNGLTLRAHTGMLIWLGNRTFPCNRLLAGNT